MPNLTEKLQRESNRYMYLSFFRLYICFHLLKRLILQWPSLETLYSTNSFIVASSHFDLEFFRHNYKIIIIIYANCIFLHAFGIGKNLTAFALFLFVELFQRMNYFVLNGGDNFLKFILLYMAFCDSYRYFSLSQLKIKNQAYQSIVNMFTNLAVLSIQLHLCLIYMVTGLHKTHAQVWFNGVATYYTMSLERFSGTSFNPAMAKNGYLVTLSTYFTILWEVYTPVLIWIKKLRPYIMLSGICLHLGIYVFMMIHDFQFLFIMVYGFFFTDDEWRHFKMKLSSFLNKNKEEPQNEAQSEVTE